MGAHRARLLLEHLAIAAGYVLLAWFGMFVMPDARLMTIWPAGGFALAMLLLRGTSRWPAILLGALIGSYLFVPWRWITGEVAAESSFQEYLAAVLMSVARTFSTVVGVWLIRRFVGTTRWPHTIRGVIGFVIIAGLVHPAFIAVMTHVTLLAGGLVDFGSVLLRQTWSWFNANSAGNMLVVPLLLALAERPTGRPPRSRWEVALVTGFALSSALVVLEARRRLGVVGIPLAYPMMPLLIWVTLRFGSQGAALFNVLLTGVTIGSLHVFKDAEPGLVQTFIQLQARLVVFIVVFLVLAAAFEERHQLRDSLEEERRNLEGRVRERTRELARSLSLLHSSIESTADGLLVVDRKGHITAMNQRFVALWRIPPSLLDGGEDTRALAFVREQLVDPTAFLRRVEYLYAHPELESEDEIALKDGRFFERFSRPQRLGEDIVGRVWSFRDITTRRRAEAERDRLLVEESRARQEAERAFREAQKAMGLRDEFLSIAAHEMKTPLTSMKMQIQQLQRLLASDSVEHVETARLRPVVVAVLRQMRRFQELSDQLLDITRLSSGRFEPHYEPLEFRAAVAELIDLHREAAARARSELRLEGSGSIRGEADGLCLQRIVCNLLSNALKFGAGAPVVVRLEAQGGWVQLQVIDRGIGIAPEDRGRIFERLERAVDARHYGGLGLGLWIARESARALGGEITVESEVGKGSTFTVELPRTRQLPLMRSGESPVVEEHPPV